MLAVRFVGGPLDGARRDVSSARRAGDDYTLTVSVREGVEAPLTYELRADTFGPADLVAVVIG